MGEAKELTSFISNIDKGVDVIYGIGFDESLGNKIKITILAAGFELSIKGDGKPAKAPAIKNPFVRAEQPLQQTEVVDVETLKQVYGDDKVKAAIRERESLRYIILQPSQFDDDAIIETFEHNPTYNRDKKIADEVRNAPAESSVNDKTESAPADAAPAKSESPNLDSLAAEAGSKEIVF